MVTAPPLVVVRGNGSGDGLLNGAASGNGEHNYGIGNGIAD